jgi:SPP1 family predicted phage head-tail adaptor
LEPGQRDWIITIQRLDAPDAVDDTGAPIENWVTLVDQMPAAKYDVRGMERFAAQQLSASYDVKWHINYRTDMDPELIDVAKHRRIVHQNRVYDIVAATMIGRREAVELLTLAKVG